MTKTLKFQLTGGRPLRRPHSVLCRGGALYWPIGSDSSSKREDIDYPTLKELMQRNGVESSVFYGKNAFFVPVHQNLTKEDLDYMIKLLNYYSENEIKK